MKKLDFLYKQRRDDIYKYYSEMGKIDVDSIEEVNDHIIDSDLKQENFENPLEEFYIIVAMCSYMAKNDLYDDYFFSSFDELLEEYTEGKYDEYFCDILKDKELLSNDISEITEYILKDKNEADYYEALSSVYESEYSKEEE